MENVQLIKRVKGINSFTKAINTDFTEFITAPPETPEVDITVERFFELYEQLFFDIPAEGEINTHQYLVERSSQYLGGAAIDPEKAALIEEINALRQQILELGDTYLLVNNLTA